MTEPRYSLKILLWVSTKVSNLNTSDILPHLRLFLIVLYYTAQNKAIQMCKLDFTSPVRTFFYDGSSFCSGLSSITTLSFSFRFSSILRTFSRSVFSFSSFSKAKGFSTSTFAVSSWAYSPPEHSHSFSLPHSRRISVHFPG